MFTHALESDLPILYAYIVARSVDDRWSRQHAPIAHAEARAVPGTLDDIAGQRALVQWSASMWAGRGNSRELFALPQQNDRHTGYGHPVQFALLDIGNRHDHFIILARRFPGSVVDACAFDKDHVTT